MKEFFGGIVLTVLLGYLGSFIAWWGIVLVGVVVGFALHRHGGIALISGFLGGGLFYWGYAFGLDYQNNGQLSAMMAELFGGIDLMAPTVVLGALLCAMGTLTGKYAHDVVFGERKVSRYRGKYR